MEAIDRCKKSKTRTTGSVLKQDPNAQKVKNNTIY